MKVQESLNVCGSGAYLQFGKPFNSLQRSQHTQHPQRLDGADVLPLAAPTSCVKTCVMTKSDRHAESVGFRFRRSSLEIQNVSGQPFIDGSCVRVNSERVTASWFKYIAIHAALL